METTAALEITSVAAKFAVGNLVDGKPVIVYHDSKDIRGCVKDGAIVDPEKVTQVIRGFSELKDESLSMAVDTSVVSLVLPPMGLTIYQSNKSTNVVAQNNKISDLDIKNAMSLVTKDRIPNDNEIADIVPDVFMDDKGKQYALPPYGQESSSITMCAKVHTLPGEVINNYRSVVERAGFRIRRKSVAPYCAAELIKADGSIKPGSYFLVDMGAHITSISLIGNSTLFRSLAFPKGGDDLTEAIASDFGIPFEEAERLKVTYGYDTRVRSYKRPLAVTRGENGQERKRYQEDLNAVIVRFIDEYEALLINAINQLVEYENARKQDIMSLDIVFTGGASLLKGLDGLFARSLQSHKLHFFSPHVMGARDPRFTNCIGIIVAGGIYKGALEDMRGGVGGLSRGR